LIQHITLDYWADFIFVFGSLFAIVASIAFFVVLCKIASNTKVLNRTLHDIRIAQSAFGKRLKKVEDNPWLKK